MAQDLASFLKPKGEQRLAKPKKDFGGLKFSPTTDFGIPREDTTALTTPMTTEQGGEFRPPFGLEKREVPGGVAFGAGADVASRILEIIPKVVSFTLANYKATQQTIAGEKPTPLNLGFDARRLGFDDKQVKDVGAMMVDNFIERERENPGKTKTNMAMSILTGPISQVLDIWGAEAVVKSLAYSGLKLTKYDSLLRQDLNRLGFTSTKDITRNSLKDAFKKEFKILAQSEGKAIPVEQQFDELGKATARIMYRLTNKGIPQLNKLGQIIRDTSETLLKDISPQELSRIPIGLSIKDVGGSLPAIQRQSQEIIKQIPKQLQFKALDIVNQIARSSSSQIANSLLEQLKSLTGKAQKPKSLTEFLQPKVDTTALKGVKQIDKATKDELIQAVDYLRIGREAPNIEDTVDRLARKFNITQDQPSTKIANKFQELIEKTKTSEFLPGTKKVNGEKRPPKTREIQEDFGRAESEVFTELQEARAGKRIMTETGSFFAEKSTFPKWVPEELRSRNLFDRVQDALLKGRQPVRAKEKMLMDVVSKQVLSRMDSEFADAKVADDFLRGISERIATEKDSFLRGIQQNIKQGIKDKRFTLKQFVRGKEVAERRGAREAKKVEQQVARRQVGFEKREAKRGIIGTKIAEMQAARRQVSFQKREARRQVAKKREEIIEKLRVKTNKIQDIKKDIVDFAKENLGPKDRGRALSVVQNAKTSRDLTKAFGRIFRWTDELEKKGIRDNIIKLQKNILNSQSIAIDYKKKIQDVLGGFELKGRSQATIDKLDATRKFIEKEMQNGKDVNIPQKILKSLETLYRTPFDKVTTSQLKGAEAELELLFDVGKTKLRTMENVIKMHKDRILRDIGNQKGEPLNKNEIIRPAVGERLTISQKGRNFIINSQNKAAEIDRAISPMDAIFDLLDGGRANYDGANFRYFKGQIDAGYGRYLTRKDKLQEPIIDLANKYKLQDIDFERIGVVAAREQDGGIEKLLNSGYSQKQIDTVAISKKEQEVLDLMRKTFDSQFTEIQDVMRRVYNRDVEKVKNYFSFMTDWKLVDDTEVFERFGSIAPEQYGRPTKNVEAGFTKARVGGGKAIKVNAMDVFLKHTDNTSYLLELGEKTKILGEIAATDRYKELVGDAGQLMVREWLDTIARKGGASGASEIAILDTLRKNVGIGILGLKLSTIAIQPTAFIDGMGFIGARYGMRGATDFITKSEWRKFVSEMPEIKDRMGGEFALRELTDKNWFQNIQRKGFIPLQVLDQMTAGSVAAGAYTKKMTELGKAIDLTMPFDKEALAYAQLAVRRTQSSGSFKDVPLAISRGNLTGNRSLDRAILQFQNFLLTRWSRVRHDAIRAGIREKDPRKAIPIFTALIFAALAGTGIRLGVNKATDFVTGREDKDSIAEDLSKGFVYEMTGTVPFLGTAVSMWMYDGEMFPILDAPKGVIGGLNRVVNSKSQTAKLKGFAEFAGSTGAILGIPGSTQAEQLARGFLSKEQDKGLSRDLNLDLDLDLDLEI